MKTPYIVIALDSHDGQRRLATHIFQPYERKGPFWLAGELANRSLCGRAAVDLHGDDYASLWVDLVQAEDAHQDMDEVTCKRCLALSRRLLVLQSTGLCTCSHLSAYGL